MKISRYPFSPLLHKTINGKRGYANDFFASSLLMSERFTDNNFHKTCEISSCIICLSETDSCQHIF